jgi:hypothetical protein
LEGTIITKEADVSCELLRRKEMFVDSQDVHHEFILEKHNGGKITYREIFATCKNIHL